MGSFGDAGDGGVDRRIVAAELLKVDVQIDVLKLDTNLDQMIGPSFSPDSTPISMRPPGASLPAAKMARLPQFIRSSPCMLCSRGSASRAML